MTQSPKPLQPASLDNSFSTFMFGITLGVIGSLLLGTEEGRKITRQVLKSVAAGIEENESIFKEVKNIAHQAFYEVESRLKTPSSLPDRPTTVYHPEVLPPLPPVMGRPKPEPTYFHNSGDPLKP